MMMRNEPPRKDGGERYRCPFYGFSQFSKHGLFLYQGGNQCGLVTTSQKPCEMEVHENLPDWNECEFNDRFGLNDLAEVFSSYTVITRESGTGIPFKE